MLKNMKMSTKLAMGFAIPALAILAMTVGIYRVTGTVKASVNGASTESQASFSLAMRAQQMKLDVVQVQQWLTDISATRGQDGLDDGFDEAENSRQSFVAGVSEFNDLYAGRGDRQKLAEMKTMKKAFDAYYETGKKMARSYVDGGPAEGNKYMADFDAAAEALRKAMDPFVEGQTLQGGAMLEAIVVSVGDLRTTMLWIGLAAILISVLAAWLIIRSITGPIHRAVDGLGESADQVALASDQVSTASQSMASGSSEQASSIEETSASLEEMSSMTRQNAENAHHADGLMKEANQIVAAAGKSMNELTAAMQEISAASEETSKIISTIDEIAFQTNLLALNAAVEAARAGEAGAGFAVVADEVRNLAMRAAEAAKNTSVLIEDTVKRIGDGADLVQKTSHDFSQVAESAGKVGDLVSEISAASGEQSQGIEQINSAVTEMDKVTQQNAANAEETASVSEEMSAQSASMKQLVAGLATLVTGTAAGDMKPARPPDGQRASNSEHVAPARNYSLKTPRAADPQELIPLEEDFKDF
jgi:methyl-accepting chemotaxis protein